MTAALIALGVMFVVCVALAVAWANEVGPIGGIWFGAMSLAPLAGLVLLAGGGLV